MPLFKFDQFSFDSTRHRLTKNGKAVALRPKASQLLALLLENKERVVPKSEIFVSIWCSEYARDHLLFQLISELRKAPFNNDFVRTVPNQGYQWNLTTKVVERKTYLNLTLILAASLAFAMICLTSLLFVYSGDTVYSDDTRNLKLTQLPAHSAFSKGVIAMHTGHPNDAEQWFRFALNENPESAESALFLAETLFQQNRGQESLETVQALLNKPNIAAYNRMTAADLLSRVHQQQGKYQDALHYAQQSSRTKVIAQCSVDAVENRIEFLKRIIEPPVNRFHDAQLSSVDADVERDTQGTQDQIPQQATAPRFSQNCQKLNTDVNDTSYCAPEIRETLYANRSFVENQKFV